MTESNHTNSHNGLMRSLKNLGLIPTEDLIHFASRILIHPMYHYSNFKHYRNNYFHE